MYPMPGRAFIKKKKRRRKEKSPTLRAKVGIISGDVEVHQHSQQNLFN